MSTPVCCVIENRKGKTCPRKAAFFYTVPAFKKGRYDHKNRYKRYVCWTHSLMLPERLRKVLQEIGQ